MNRLHKLQFFLSCIFNEKNSKKKEMKRVFQLRRYLEWKELTSEERLSAKRLLLIPVFTYLIITILNQYLSLIIIFLIGYLLYKKFEKRNSIKK